MAQRMTGGEDLARHGQRRHTHPQRLACGETAGIGKRVEHDVDVVVLPDESPMGRWAAQLYAPWLDAVRGEFRCYAFRGRGGGELMRLEHQPRVRQAMQDIAPCGDDARRDLGQVVEATEGDVA